MRHWSGCSVTRIRMDFLVLTNMISRCLMCLTSSMKQSIPPLLSPGKYTLHTALSLPNFMFSYLVSH